MLIIISFFFYLPSATDINPIAAQCALQTAKENGVNICTVITDLVSQVIHLPPIVAIKREKFTKIYIFLVCLTCLSCETLKMQAFLSFFFFSCVCAVCVSKLKQQIILPKCCLEENFQSFHYYYYVFNNALCTPFKLVFFTCLIFAFPGGMSCSTNSWKS